MIAPSLRDRRRLARALAELSRTFALLAWKVADTHLHLLHLGDEAACTELVRRLRIWFANALRPGVPLEVQRRKPLPDQSHLVATFRYVLAQDAHHAVDTDRWQEASSLADTLGLRVLCPELALRVREHLPRLKREALLAHLGVDALEPAVHPAHLVEAAAAAWALDGLPQRGDGADARRAAVHAAHEELGTAAVAEALGVTRQCVARLLHEELAPRAVRAVGLQMALRAARPAAAPFAER